MTVTWVRKGSRTISFVAFVVVGGGGGGGGGGGDGDGVGDVGGGGLLVCMLG